MPSWEYRVDHKRLLDDEPQEPVKHIWFKTSAPVPDDPVLQTALLVYQSDSSLLSTARLPHKGTFRREELQVASLDHAMFFHRRFDVSDWMLYALDSPSAGGARGLSRGLVFDRTGRLVASTAQEGLIRRV